MLGRVAETISRYSMFRQEDPVAAAVSGGADSIFLLHALRALFPAQCVTVLHLNHKLRGAESDADEGFVREVAAALGVAFESRQNDVAASGGNLEQAGRRARLAFFREVLRTGAVKCVATGHTFDDQAETVLYRLLRGSGTQGLRGILPVTANGLVRPLLAIRRREIESWLTERGIAWRDDATNRDPRFLRNRIRHGLLPLLETQYNPRIRETLARTAEIALGEEAYWDAEVARAAPELWNAGARELELGVEHLRNLPVALARRVIRRALAEIRGDTRGLSAGHVEEVLELVRRDAGGGRVQLPGVEAIRSFADVRLAPPQSGNVGVAVQVIESYNEGGTIDADSVPTGAELRGWRPGDRLELSPGRTVKLKELFQRARIPVWERRDWPVFASGNEVIWTRRFGVGAPYAARRETRRFLQVVEGSPGA